MTKPTSTTEATVGLPERLSRLLRVLVGRPELRQRGSMFAVALVLRLAGVALLGWVGYVHWLLWHLGYQHISVDGPFFLIDAIAGVVLAVVLLVWPRPLAGLLGAGFVASTIAALLISLSVGLFGFRESISASYVVLALVLESIAVVILLAWMAIAVTGVARRPNR
ncbi:MAG TPA: hypothetical protein VNF47_03480 [Streptosporangiaceae bacterium]|nr:hypothetical protein [Streptosporangiaceae bacterium]